MYTVFSYSALVGPKSKSRSAWCSLVEIWNRNVTWRHRFKEAIQTFRYVLYSYVYTSSENKTHERGWVLAFPPRALPRSHRPTFLHVELRIPPLNLHPVIASPLHIYYLPVRIQYYIYACVYMCKPETASKSDDRNASRSSSGITYGYDN